ncbi:MAG TPA: hypothetical protein ACFYD4_10060 [Candidatus Wunengus sp. YC61]|uniref:hypothetical protein n=1 Tax=Candidatus Wunengus sp. YC61 TaxID=3367698 RepID=UPI004024C3B1
MLRFIKENNRAMIFDDVGSEDGWVVEFDDSKKKFLVWDSAERHAMKQDCCVECNTLEEVLATVNSYT